MAKQIKRSDIAEEDIYKGIRESADKTIQVISKVNEEFKMQAVILKDIVSGAKFDKSKGINEFNKAVEQTGKLTQQTIKNEQELQKARELRAKADERLEKLAQSKLKTDEQAIKTAETQARAEARKAKETEKAAKAAADESNAYKKLEKNTRELKNESKRLAAEMLHLENAGEKNTKEFREMAREYKKVTAAAQQGDEALKKIDGTVGDNFRKVGNYNGAISKLQNGLGKLGLAFGFGAVVTNAGQTIVEFDQKIADLVAITGAGGDDLKFFKEQAIELGKGVQGGAAEVIEAYKLIGSAKPELLENAKALDAVTQSAITLSQASGMTLPEAATALTDAMNQFGAPAEKAGQFIDALANGALFGSAEIPQVTEALLKFGAVANTTNVSLEESTALIEALAEKGLKGAEAGTALRNVMLKLSAPDALPKEAQERLKALGISFEDLKDKSKPFSERLKLLKPLLEDNAAMVKVFGTENAVAATNLIGNTDRIAELTEQMHTQGTATKQAEDRTKTLSFALNELKESWNAIILQFSKGEGTSKILVETLSFIAQNLGTILGLIAKVGLAWAAYRTTMAGVKAAQFLMNGGLKDTIKGMGDAFKSTKKLADGAAEAGENIGKAGKAMTAVPWIAIIAVVIELATALYDVASGAAAAREQQELLDKYTAAASEKATARVTKRGKEIQKEIAELQRLRNENQITEKEFLKRKQAAINATQKEVQTDIKAVQVRQQAYTEYYNRLNKLTNEFKKGGNDPTKTMKEMMALSKQVAKEFGIQGDASWVSFFTGQNDDATPEQVLRNLTAMIGATNEKIKIYREELDDVTEATKDANSEIKVNTQAHEDNSKKINAKIPKQREYNTELRLTNEYLSQQTELLNELDALQKEKEIRAVQTDIDTQLANDIKRAKETGDAEVELLEELIAKKYELEKQAAIMRQQFELEQLEETYRIEGEKALQALNDERDKLLAQEGLTAEARAKIEANYQTAKDQLEMDNLQRQADLELKKRILAEETGVELIEIEKRKQEEINDVNNQIIDAQTEYAATQVKEAEKATEAVKKNYDAQREIVKMAADYFIQQSEKKIAQLEKEISAAEKTYDMYRELAINGNIDAKESLAEQQRLINEANIRKEQEQKRIERIKLAEAVYNGYTANVEKGEANPLAKTITDITLLRQFVASLPTFYEGTDTTVGDALGAPHMPGRDGYVVRVDKDEKILNPSLSKMTGNLTTSEIARVSQDYLTGKLIRSGDSAVQIGGGWLTPAMINKMDEVKHAIENMPRDNYELGRVTQESFSLIRKTIKGNDIIYNRYKVK